MIYKVFDAPSVPGPFVSRLAAAEATLCALAQAALAGGEPRRVHVAQTAACEDLATAIALRTRVESFGGEGLVLRRAGSFFRPGKAADSRDVLKFKARPPQAANSSDPLPALGAPPTWRRPFWSARCAHIRPTCLCVCVPDCVRAFGAACRRGTTPRRGWWRGCQARSRCG